MKARVLRPDVVTGLFGALGLAAITETRLLGDFEPTGQVEVAAVVLYVLSVWLATNGSIYTWPTGIGATALYLYLFGEWRLYADAGLQLVFIGFSVWGWCAWSRRDALERIAPRRASLEQLALVLLLVAVGTGIVSTYLAELGGAAPFWDALLTAGSLGALYLLIRGFLETWYVWALLDVAYVMLFLSRGVYLTAALYAVLLAMVVKAAVAWRARLIGPVEATA